MQHGTATASPPGMAPSAAHGTPHYGVYWKAWGVLLGITLVMLYVHSAPVIMIGIAAKALIILMWFMHLKTEHKDLVTTVVVGIFATSLVMYYLMAWDARGM